ncbi:hypothetical protein BCR44DRAFT_335763 [Catenaria anguillulae PL171]|uniref:Uncharacterized protein n=1 Tax=Catenaria anguillulae PL171 TaxID=765915 RepID=A0A1Y2HHW3_9FUNG|nr:hypothetical protein BCR44DRAFT_335763 [Catenaria anguillulae PL171]
MMSRGRRPSLTAGPSTAASCARSSARSRPAQCKLVCRSVSSGSLPSTTRAGVTASSSSPSCLASRCHGFLASNKLATCLAPRTCVGRDFPCERRLTQPTELSARIVSMESKDPERISFVLLNNVCQDVVGVLVRENGVDVSQESVDVMLSGWNSDIPSAFAAQRQLAASPCHLAAPIFDYRADNVCLRPYIAQRIPRHARHDSANGHGAPRPCSRKRFVVVIVIR